MSLELTPSKEDILAWSAKKLRSMDKARVRYREGSLTGRLWPATAGHGDAVLYVIRFIRGLHLTGLAPVPCAPAAGC